MARNFEPGQTVVINFESKRLPRWIRDGIKNPNGHRTIEQVWYDRKTKHTRYYLGYNGRGLDISSYRFRAEELKFPTFSKAARRARISKAKNLVQVS